MSILHAIQNASIKEVELDNGLTFRIKKICSADIAKAGVAFMAMASPDMEQMDEAAIMKRLPPEAAGKMAMLQEATVAAGVMSVSAGDDFEDVTLVMEKDKEDPDSGRLWVGSLPAGTMEILFAEVMELSTDGEGASQRLKSFRSAGEPPTVANDRGAL